ncbi:MAG: hypothetical protein J7521_01640 [Caulobacter sp.]|nr:hypothetical protein [Caulobacter sp.]
MSHLKNTGFADRLSAAAEAKKAMLAKMKPKPTVQDPNFENRHAEREAELEAVRAARAAEKEAAREAARLAELEEQAAKREERKARKAAEAADSKVRKELKAAQREELRSLGRSSKAARAHAWADLIS